VLVEPPPLAPPPPLAIETEPAGAEIAGAGERCTSPCQLAHPSAVAPTLVRARAPGYLPWASLVPPRTTTVRAHMHRAPARAAVIRLETPAEGDVVVDGAPAGAIASDPIVVEPGEHLIAVGARSVKVTVKVGETKAVMLAGD
jgi:hypothetical protein